MEKEIVLTAEGYNKLTEELHFLETKKRREIAERIKQSIEFGDLSENSEYDDAKNEQAFVEGRIIQINELLCNAKVIDGNGQQVRGRVGLGSIILLEDRESGEQEEYQLVGSVEADPTNHRISNESPVGQAIIDKRAGDIVRVRVPQGILEYKIVKVKRPKH
ncbi:MAG: transcription elongation factor GreA [Actinobacteria bacterium]|nr:transcription elongation factor GreA [Actinomycetota bacterium]